MADIMDILGSQLGSAALQQVIGKQLGIDQSQSQSAISAALPVLLGALQRNTQSPGGASALASALDKDHDGSILDDLAGFIPNAQNSKGGNILGHVLGGKRNNVEQYVSKSSGLNQQSSGQLLEMLAPIVMGALGKQKKSTGLDAGGIAGMLGGLLSNGFQPNAPAQLQAQQWPKAEPKETNKILGALLDSDGDGDISDDIINLGGKLLGGLFGGKK